MKLLSRLFKKSPPKIPSIDEQIQALATRSDVELVNLASQAGNENLREAAISKLRYGPELLGLAVGHQPVRIQTAARKRISQLLDDNTLNLTQLEQDLQDPIELIAALRYSTAASLQIVERINDEAILIRLVSDASTTQIRQAAAAKINSRDHLEQLAKAAQNKDKNVYKLIKMKLEFFKTQDAKQAEVVAAATAICLKLEKHLLLEADPLFKARLQVLQQEWSAFNGTAPSDIVARYQAAANACLAKLAARAEALAKEEEKILLDQQALSFAEAALTDVKKLIVEIYAAPSLDETSESSYRQRLEELTQAIRLAGNRALPMQGTVSEFEYRKQQATNLLDQVKSYGTLTELSSQLRQTETAELSSPLVDRLNQLLKYGKDVGDEAAGITNEAKEVINNWHQQRKQIEQNTKNTLREFNELIRKGLWATEQGFVRKARTIQKELSEKRHGLENLPKGLQTKLDDFEQQLLKLGDWHEFAVTPKKEALISQMQALINSSLAPEDLATKIHELQDSWKEVSKGGQQQDEELWQQFQQASDQAYLPCKQFFDAQAAIRDSNLEKRQEMVTQLQSYLNSYDWSNAVWQEVEKILKVARREWQTYWPVPRKAGNELQKKFEALMEQLFSKITSACEHNKQLKQALIEKAKSLLEVTEVRQAIESVKQLQVEWKNIGKSWHKEDQLLWQEFRQHCDAIFARRNQEAEAINQQRSAVQQQAKALIDKLNALLPIDSAQSTITKSEIDTIKNEFYALDLSPESAKLLTAQLNESLTALANKQETNRRKAQEQSWNDLFAAADAIREYEVAIIAQRPAEQLANMRHSVEAIISNTLRWPSGSQALIQQRLAKALYLEADTQIVNTSRLRTLTIRAEILAGRETPESDKNLRMSYQVQQMQQAFGQRDSAFEPLVLEWISIGGVPCAPYNELLNRFNASRLQGLKSA